MGRRRRKHKHLPRSVYFRHGAYYFVDTQGKLRHLGRSVGEMYAALGQIHTDPGNDSTIAGVIERYQRQVLPGDSAKVQKNKAKHLERLRASLGDLAADELSPRHIYMVRDRVAGRMGRAAAHPFRANRMIETLSHVCTFAVEWGYIDRNPCREVKALPEPKRQRYVSDEEYEAVYRHCTPMIQCAMDIAVLTGLRRGDILSLTRDCITDEGLLVATSKTKKQLDFEWSEALRAAVNRALAQSPRFRRSIICNREGKPYTGDGFNTVWTRARQKALDVGDLQQPFRFNDLRAKSASDDQNAERASLRLGHNSRDTTERFYRVTPRKVEPLR